jgi:hypothetical protein
MPAGRAERMRADVLNVIAADRTARAGSTRWWRAVPPQRRRPGRRRLALIAAAAAAAVAVGVTATAVLRHEGEPVRILAMAASEMTPEMRDAATDCLAHRTIDGVDKPQQVTMSQLAVAAQNDHRAAVLFLSDTGYLACDVWTPKRQEASLAVTGDDWKSRDWLPGPVQRVLLTSTEIGGGDVTVLGRISDRVHRLVLEHGDGHITVARLASGVFGLVSAGGTVTKQAQLVSYDASGAEIGRRPLFRPQDQDGKCYVDPAGAIVYGKPGGQCEPAQKWAR